MGLKKKKKTIEWLYSHQLEPTAFICVVAIRLVLPISLETYPCGIFVMYCSFPDVTEGSSIFIIMFTKVQNVLGEGFKDLWVVFFFFKI